MEAPTPSKRNSGRKFDDYAGVTFSSITALSVTVPTSEVEPMKETTDLAKWHLPSIGIRFLFWNKHQAGSSVILENIAKISNEIKVEALDCTMRHFMEQLHKRLDASRRITID